jgi:hypothetical protein
MPTKLAPQLVSQSNANVIASRIREEIDNALDELSEDRDEYQHLASIEESDSGMEATAETDDLGMG